MFTPDWSLQLWDLFAFFLYTTFVLSCIFCCDWDSYWFDLEMWFEKIGKYFFSHFIIIECHFIQGSLAKYFDHFIQLAHYCKTKFHLTQTLLWHKFTFPVPGIRRSVRSLRTISVPRRMTTEKSSSTEPCRPSLGSEGTSDLSHMTQNTVHYINSLNCTYLCVNVLFLTLCDKNVKYTSSSKEWEGVHQKWTVKSDLYVFG